MTKVRFFLSFLILVAVVFTVGAAVAYVRIGHAAAGMIIGGLGAFGITLGLRFLLEREVPSDIFKGSAPYATDPKSNQAYLQSRDGIDHHQPVANLLLFLALFAFGMAVFGYILVTYFPNTPAY